MSQTDAQPTPADGDSAPGALPWGAILAALEAGVLAQVVADRLEDPRVMAAVRLAAVRAQVLDPLDAIADAAEVRLSDWAMRSQGRLEVESAEWAGDLGDLLDVVGDGLNAEPDVVRQASAAAIDALLVGIDQVDDSYGTAGAICTEALIRWAGASLRCLGLPEPTTSRAEMVAAFDTWARDPYGLIDYAATVLIRGGTVPLANAVTEGLAP